MREYLKLEDLLAIHELCLQHYGGAKGVRDLGAIESALFRPQSGYYSDTIEEAAALTESMLINHPFMALRMSFVPGRRKILECEPKFNIAHPAQ